MKKLNYLALFSAIALLFPISLFGRNKNEGSVEIDDPVKVGNTQLKPGDYKVEWNGTGPAVEVTFLRHGRSVATAPATLKTDPNQARQDDIVVGTTNAKIKTLKEIDFAHDNQILVFGQSGM